MRRVFITGDTHADFGRLWRLSRGNNTSKEDMVIILGDSGINYMTGGVARVTKENLSRMPLTIVCVHGNHERRAESIETYHETEWCGGKAFIEEAYPSIIFLKDGEVYNILGRSFFVIGGAYSPDKKYRIEHHYPWFDDEQPSDSTKKMIESMIGRNRINVDYVLTHTCPYKYIPFEELQNGAYGEIDYSTEIWLEKISGSLKFDKWFCGHYHIDKEIDSIVFMFENVRQLI